MEFLTANLLGIAVGVILKTLVPMPFVDRWVRLGWIWLLANTLGRL